MPSDEETLLKIISQRLDQINTSLDKLNNKLDHSQEEVNMIKLQLRDIEVSRKYKYEDIDALKEEVQKLKELSTKVNLIFGISSFCISIIVTILTKIFIH